MKIYLCGRYSLRDWLQGVRTTLHFHGHTVTSRWLNTCWEGDASGRASAAPPEYREEYAIKDLEDVIEAECLIAFTESRNGPSRGGRHVEFGVALALGKRLIVVGYRENLFYYHPRVKFFEDWQGALEALSNSDKGGLA